MLVYDHVWSEINNIDLDHVNHPQALQAQCEHGRQKYKDLYENPDKKLKKIVIWKNLN